MGSAAGDAVSDHSVNIELRIGERNAGAQSIVIGAVYTGPMHFHVRIDAGG